ncbi:hypothetical protein HAX54_011292, partial [Datura stramonium]|nr:hypothetical protein [Datura stramonium]
TYGAQTKYKEVCAKVSVWKNKYQEKEGLCDGSVARSWIFALASVPRCWDRQIGPISSEGARWVRGTELMLCDSLRATLRWIRQRCQLEERVKLRGGVWKYLESVNVKLKVHHRVTLRMVCVEQRATVHGWRKKFWKIGRRKIVKVRYGSVERS